MTSILNDIIILLLIFYDEKMLTLLLLSELNRNVIAPEERDINQADVTRALGTVDAELVFAGPKKK